MSVVVIEDQPSLLRSLTQAFRESDFSVVAVSSLAAADSVCRSPVDLIVLDLMLPDGCGLEWLRRYRSEGFFTSVIVVTARDSVEDRILGLDSGADDYMVKPFEISELMARARALIRREHRSQRTILSVEDVSLDLLARTVKRRGISIELPQRQFDLLAFFMKNANAIVTREMLAEHIWKDMSAMWTNVIEVHINQLRKRLEIRNAAPLLHTVRGKGYIFGGRPQ